jgi:hypothetical protein
MTQQNSVGSSGQAVITEVEITPQMVAAGAAIIEAVFGYENLFGKVDAAALAVEVYNSMAARQRLGD